MSIATANSTKLREKIWRGSIPLEVRLASNESRTYDKTDPYIIYAHRLSYLPFLLQRIHSFFISSLIDPNVNYHDGWFSFEEIPLKWHNPIGLLFDLYAGNEAAYPSPAVQEPQVHDAKRQVDSMLNLSSLPWKLVVHFHDWPSESLIKLDRDGIVLHDSFINSVKEADFLRNGSAKAVMSLSKDDSTSLWKSVQDHDFRAFDVVNQKLVAHPGTPLRHIPIKMYLPSSSSTLAEEAPNSGALCVIQSLVTPMLGPRQLQTVGSTLNFLLPSLFPSRRRVLFAEPVLHGAVVPLHAPLEEVSKVAAYADGWLHLAIAMLA